MEKTTKAFQTAYAALNQEQKQAVDTIDGPIMVVAGPGTGKTQIIALRIANILLKTDAEPDEILALTFTESAAKEMRERLASFIGHTAYYVTISTFHSFCTDVIRENPDHFIIDPSTEPLSNLERLKIFHKLLDEKKWQYIRPINAPYLYVKALMGSIQDLKREAVDPNEFKKVLEEENNFLQSDETEELTKTELNKRTRDLNKNQELQEIYTRYQEELRASKNFDFEDMINFAINALADSKELLSIYQERYHYFLVDEYQDTNSAQNEVVDLLASFWEDKANVFVVGDPDQSIFRFQGASIENMLSFVDKYKNPSVITLKNNYRSNQTILDASHNLIVNNNLRIDDVVKGTDFKLLSATNLTNSKIQIAELTSSPAEDLFIAEEIQNLINSGTEPGEIAVIYRTNADGERMAEILSKFNIDYTTQGGANILEDPVVKKLLKIFRVIYEMRTKKEDLNLFTILNYDLFNINPLDVLKFSRKAAETKLTLFDVLENQKILGEINLKNQKQLENVLTQLGKWQKLDADNTFIKFFETVLNESGFLNWILESDDSHHKVSRINALFSEIKKMNNTNHDLNLSSFIKDLNLMEENKIKIQEPEFTRRKDAVILTTAHSAKGLEWKYVFIYKTYDRQWGNNLVRKLIKLPNTLLPVTGEDLDKMKEREKQNEDERRLFYVALTRAKKQVIATYANTYQSPGRTKEVIPSMFISEIPSNLKQSAKTEKSEKELAHHLEKLLTKKPGSSEKVEKDEKEFLKSLVKNFRLSVTALNTYLECPYKFKLNNLLKVPRAKASYLAFGTAIHSALESFYRKFKEDSLLPNKEHLLESFQKALAREILTKDEYEERLAQGSKILSAYYDFYKNDFQEPLLLEKYSRVMLGDITLTGKIDRIEWHNKTEKTARVIDYKSGKPKTRGQIEGKTQDSKGNLKRQLTFYKMLIDLDRRLKINFGEAELDFVETPSLKDKSGKQRFHITAEEVEELKRIIRTVMSEIRVLKFPRTTDHTNCSRCEFKDHCYPSGLPTQ